MDILQLASDSKIYISCWGGGSYAIHVINQPDSFGLACDFRMYGQQVLSQSPLAIPYFPNYRLGALPGSCDTITSLKDIADAHPAFATITPNPASRYATLIYYTGSNRANHATMYDLTGREVWSAEVSGSSGHISIDLSGMTTSMYTIRFTAGDHPLLHTKLVVTK